MLVCDVNWVGHLAKRISFISCAGLMVACSANPAPAVVSPPPSAGTDAAGPKVAQRSSAPSLPFPNRQASGTPWFGTELTQTVDGVVVGRVWRGSPAATAGVQTGDRLLSLAGQGASGVRQWRAMIRAQSLGERLSLAVRRGGEARLLPLVLLPKPKPQEILEAQFVGLKAPELTGLKVVTGSVEPSLRSLEGKVVVLEFWAGWCDACRALTPTLNRWHRSLGVQGVRVLGVTTDPFQEAQFGAAEFGFEYPALTDPQGTVSRAYGALMLPSLFVIDQQGIVRQVMVGIERARLRELDRLVRDLSTGD